MSTGKLPGSGRFVSGQVRNPYMTKAIPAREKDIEEKCIEFIVNKIVEMTLYKIHAESMMGFYPIGIELRKSEG